MALYNDELIESLEQRPDEELVELARCGDKEAMNALLTRHRNRMFGWARNITRDAHLAEDVVQEALVRAFLKLATLTDVRRFLPWLQTIVRNSARMKLRRGGPHGREKPLSAFDRSGTAEEPDWSNMETVLSELMRRNQTHQTRVWTDDPANCVVEPELAELMSVLLPRLGAKERLIFEKHFYEQISPTELAEHFNTSLNNVHKTISRARQKLQREHMELDIRASLRMHLDRHGRRQAMIAEPPILGQAYMHPDAAFIDCLYYTVSYAGHADMTMTDVMGYSGYAFLLQLVAHNAAIESLFYWDWDTYWSNAILNFGMYSRFVDYQHFVPAPHSPHRTRNLMFALDVIRESVDQGFPAWVTSCSRYGCQMIYGYDDEEQVLYSVDPDGREKIPYIKLAAGVTNSLYLFACDGKFDLAPDKALTRLLTMMVNHARGNVLTFGGCVNGLAAYDAWISALRRGEVQELGHAFHAMTVGKARRYGADFWLQRANRLPQEWVRVDGASGLVSRIAECYDYVAGCFGRLHERFPYPSGGQPNEPEQAAYAVSLLEEARRAESEAIECAERLLELLHSKGRNGPAPGLVPIHPLYCFGHAFENNREDFPAARFAYRGQVVHSRRLRRSIRLYAALFGRERELDDGILNRSIYDIPMDDGISLLLMDPRLDLVHADWRPQYLIWTEDILKAKKRLVDHKFAIVTDIMKGARSQFFVCADPDDNQLLVYDGSLRWDEPPLHAGLNDAAASYPPSIPFRLAARNPQRSAELYDSAFMGLVPEIVEKLRSGSDEPRLCLQVPDVAAAYRVVRQSGVRIVRHLAEKEREAWAAGGRSGADEWARSGTDIEYKSGAGKETAPDAVADARASYNAVSVGNVHRQAGASSVALVSNGVGLQAGENLGAGFTFVDHDGTPVRVIGGKV